MKKFLSSLAIITIIIFAFIYRQDIFSRFQGLQEPLSELSTELAQRVGEQVNLPEPLRVPGTVSNTKLTHEGVVTLTNQERNPQGLPSLRESNLLNQAAKNKLDDMFSQQYFEHISPDGKGPSDLAKAVGYHYIIVGENLAEGGFKDDADLVAGWMNSPGHRANILNAKYQEIGVAVGHGLMDGRKVWLAVQEFGTPLSACPAVDEQLKVTIDTNEREIKQKSAALKAQQDELDQRPGESREDYKKRIDQYNDEVAAVNNLIDRTKALVERYNAQVSRFNECVKG